MIFDAALAFIATVFFLISIFFSYKLSNEAKGEKYWLFFLIAALGFGISHLASKNFFEILQVGKIFAVREVGEIIGALSLAYATYGLYSSMKKIREKIGNDLEE